jgi:long-chain acyl-CoA synthetase
MSKVISAIREAALASPANVALEGTHYSMTYAELAAAIEHAAQYVGTAVVLGIAMDNDPAWAVFDLAALKLGLTIVPLPYFFSPTQIIHAIDDAGINVIVSDQPIVVEQLLSAHGKDVLAKIHYPLAGKLVTQFTITPSNTQALPSNTAKVTYTSGTTGNPKGVCLGEEAMLQVAISLKQATHASSSDRHLSMLPLSTLLENIAGLYVPLLAGATAVLLPAVEVGLSGAAGLNVETMIAALQHSKATTTVLTPELLRALIMALEAGYPKPANLRFIAVGGAAVSPQLLRRAEALDLPVFEGYGLSECASVVALNTAEAHRAGSVGKPLPHVQLRFAEDGEILVQGACLLGYSGNHKQPSQHYFATGDVGHVDDDGYLHITGRKKNMFITSFGRNVAPEWVERELGLSPAIAQAALFGEARPWNVAIMVPRKNANGDFAQAEEIERAIAEVNASLPDYARVTRWIFAQSPFTPQNGQLTVNGRLKRDAIWKMYESEVNALYEETINAVL